MSEEKDTKKEKGINPPAGEEKTSDTLEKKVEKKSFDVDLELSDVPENKDKLPGIEELPDDIKKKLEEKKKDKGGKKLIKKRKKKDKVRVEVGKVYIKATYNNTIVSVTDLNGNVISWASAGIAGFKGPKKATSYAAQIIARIAIGKARDGFGLKDVSVFVKGVGTGREAAVRSINANGLNVTSIKDITPIPHNGCRPKKPRRV